MVYGRAYGDRELTFEPSGGLMYASLVMQDKETDSYWPIMTGVSLAGEYRGTRLVELSFGTKAQWKDWVAEHPDTLVLSVDGIEHVDDNPYDNYFASDKAFRGSEAEDDRLPAKASIYAFHLDGNAYAVPFESFFGGAAFDVAGRTVFLYRPPGAALFLSTAAFVVEGALARREGAWTTAGGATFDPEAGVFAEDGADQALPLGGFDTFWFNWSMTNPSTVVVE